ncbi:hypothetical protein OS493_019356 [Desmophyllum pertusum]|uniref:Uncharacterized protein n=1 Tax=Desmophyllum pertusum TaxID=174260 RepID=A0A9X0A1D7_9CNID|nr:hypothetical protein OS493_019356 [Desmophyllum pertusum]
MGAQKTFQAVKGAITAACGLRNIEENYDEETGVPPPSAMHSYLTAEKDQKYTISIVCGLKPFKEIPGRHHITFPHLPKSPFDLVDIQILEEWMKTSKQKLTRDPDKSRGKCCGAST